MRHTELVLYGNFNCPYSYVASLLTDTLTKAGVTSVKWRAVEHDRTIPVQGRSVVGPVARRLTRHLENIRTNLANRYDAFDIVSPRVLSNTGPSHLPFRQVRG